MFGQGIDWKRTLIFILIMIGLNTVLNGLGNFDLMNTLLTLPGLVLALTVHEYSHARMADRLGDPTPEAQGRITLNPLAHLDPVGTICLLFAGFGWGKSVQTNPTYYRNPSRDNMLVALAGPLSNIILAFVLFFIWTIVYIFVPLNNITEILFDMLMLGAFINLCLGIFNLLPVPPLDGSKILSHFVKGNARKILWAMEQYSTIILIVLFFTELPSRIVQPIVYWLSGAMLTLVTTILGQLL